jgi:hypothetical protein
MDMMKLMKRAASLQKDMAKLQEELAGRQYEFSSGGGMVRVVARGDTTVERVEIDPKVVDPQDVDMLQDLVTSAVNGALQAARESASAEMGKLTGGMGLPGM